MLSPFLSVPYSCDEAFSWLEKRLSQNGLRVMRTFDLHDARLGLDDCPCPHHGTDQCDCQMLVLLVYGKSTEPATLILHGNNEQTWISLADQLSQRAGAKTITAIQQALEIQASADNT